MSEKKELPLSGYSLVAVYATLQEMRHKESAPDKKQGGITFGWDWRFAADDLFEVQINVGVEPTAERSDYKAVTLVGRFRKLGTPTALHLKQFVQVQAVAILLPYARQALSNLTVMSAHGAYYLPPVNVMTLMSDFDFESTTGSQQLAERQKSEAQKAPQQPIAAKRHTKTPALRHK